MNPSVQVALISVLATTITTIGVVLASVINGQKERAKATKIVDSVGVRPTYDEKSLEDVLDRLLMLIDENERQEVTIRVLRKQIGFLKDDIKHLRAQLAEKEQDPNI